MSMKNSGRHNDKKHREIKGSDKYVTLDILLNFGSMENMIITSLDPKDNFGKIRKGVDCLSVSQGQRKAKGIKKGKVCHHKCHYEVPFKDYQGVLQVTL